MTTEEVERLCRAFGEVAKAIAFYVPEAMPELSFPRDDVRINPRHISDGEPGRASLSLEDIAQVARTLRSLSHQLSEAREKLDWLTSTGGQNDRTRPRIIDLCFTAWQRAKDDGDWFNDTKPVLDEFIEGFRAHETKKPGATG